MEWRQEGSESVPDCGPGHSRAARCENRSPVLGCHSYQKWVELVQPSPCMKVWEAECSERHPRQRKINFE